LLRYIIQRLLSLIPVMLVVSIIVFLIIHLTPGNPAYIILGEDSSKESIQQLEHELGLDQPIAIQFFDWIKNMLTGDLGMSVYSSEPVLDIILSHFGPTFSLMAVSLFLMLLIAVPAAIFAVIKRNTAINPLFLSGSLIGVSLPEFWFAMLLVIAFGVTIPIFPVAGYIPIDSGILEWLHHLFLPAFVLAVVEAGLISRMLRDEMLEAVGQDYTRTARAKGMKESAVIMRHTFRNALIPSVTVIGTATAGLLGGTVIIETLFTIPGIGQLLIDSIHRRDFPVIQGVVLFTAVIYVIVNLIVDLLYALFDPRIRYD